MTPHIEILPPKQDSEKLDADLALFAEKFNRVMQAGYTACITDNAMGKAAFQAMELITELELEVPNPDQIHVHLNTFHTKADLDATLDFCLARGIKNILVLTGDGSERLYKLQPADLAEFVDPSEAQTVTSVTLLKYIHARNPGAFNLGVAFNPYEPEDHEFAKLDRKVAAGAQFIVTQPIIESHPAVDKLLSDYKLPVTLECWMSKKLHLLSDAVGYTIPEDTPYDPFACLDALRRNYPACGLYLALLGFKTQWDAAAAIFPPAAK